MGRVDLPRVDQSAMDGYVVRQEDVCHARPLPVTGVAASGAPAPALVLVGMVLYGRRLLDNSVRMRAARTGLVRGCARSARSRGR